MTEAVLKCVIKPKVNRRASKCVYQSRSKCKDVRKSFQIWYPLPTIHTISFHLKHGISLFEAAKILFKYPKACIISSIPEYSFYNYSQAPCAGHCLLASALTELTAEGETQAATPGELPGLPHHPEAPDNPQCLPAPRHPQTGISMHGETGAKVQLCSLMAETGNFCSKNICIYKNQAVTNAITNKSGKGIPDDEGLAGFRFTSRKVPP